MLCNVFSPQLSIVVMETIHVYVESNYLKKNLRCCIENWLMMSGALSIIWKMLNFSHLNCTSKDCRALRHDISLTLPAGYSSEWRIALFNAPVLPQMSITL